MIKHANIYHFNAMFHPSRALSGILTAQQKKRWPLATPTFYQYATDKFFDELINNEFKLKVESQSSGYECVCEE